MKLRMAIQNIKCIKDLTVEFPVEKGLYAITGENATGKSTITMCASSLFFRFDTKQYLGKLGESSSISFELDGQRQSLAFDSKGNSVRDGHIGIKGFYEGSLIFGNRFRNTSYKMVDRIDRIDDADTEAADDFIGENLGFVLCNDKSYYRDLYRLREGLQNEYGLGGIPFFYVKNGVRINQAHMSTGENLLLSILYSLKERIDDRGNQDTPSLILLDEIELALHASSLRRLVVLLRDIANRYNMAIYFSTHSIELIRDMTPDRIFYIQRFIDGSIDVMNPCYPAFATKNLYDCNMGYDDVILVEDDLARAIINDILRECSLLGNRLVNVLPCGGWQNVLRLARDIMQSNLLGASSKIIVILDGDIEGEVAPFLAKNNMNLSIPRNYLPVPSLEKYLKLNLYDQVDQKLTEELDNYIFQREGLKSILQRYKNDNLDGKEETDGKKLFYKLSNELTSNGKSREDLVNILIRFMRNNSHGGLQKIREFLEKHL